jgi:Mn-containing catalase
MLIDIATEELSHLEVIGTIVAMLNKGAKGRLSEAVDSEAELYKNISGHGNSSHVTQVLCGGGPAFTNSGGQLWNAGYIDSIGDPTCDLRSNIAAEARAKIIYERLINLTADAGVREALGFLMTREVAHQKSFEKALYAIEPNFPPGKLPGDPRFADIYFDMSQDDLDGGTMSGDGIGPWNQGEQWKVVSERARQGAVDGGDGTASVGLAASERAALKALAKRTQSQRDADPLTGADLGAGPGAGSVSGDTTPQK